MSSQTNIALNSRSMNGIITISDGSATIENGELNCTNINSDLATIQNLTVPNINGDNLTNCTLINCDCSADPTVSLGVATKGYVDGEIVDKCFRLTASNILTGTNVYTGSASFTGLTGFSNNLGIGGQATFTTYAPYCNISPTVNKHLTRKDYVDNSISTALTGLVSLTATQTFTGINTFSNTTEFDGAINSYDQNTFYGSCPKSLIPATTSTDLTNKNFVDGAITSLTTTITALITKNYGGVYLLKAIAGAGNYISFPLMTSRTNLTNWTSQPSTSGALTTAQSGTVVGNFSSINVNDADTLYVVLPLYGLIVYQNSGYTGTIYLNYKNTTTSPVVVSPSTALGGTSVRIYYDGTEQT